MEVKKERDFSKKVESRQALEEAEKKKIPEMRFPTPIVCFLP